MSTYEKHKMGDPRLPFIFHRFYCKKGSASTGNWHENIELICVTKGTATVITDEKTFSLPEGHLAVINANCIHEIRSAGILHYYCLIVNREFCVTNYFDTSTIQFSPIVKDDEIFDLVSQFAKEYSEMDAPFRILSLRSLLLRIMTLLCQRHSVEGEKSYEETRLLSSIKDAIGYIHSESHRALTLDELANIAGMSKCYLSRTFHRLTGHTVSSYINHVRCEKAKILLAEAKMTVESIARNCGYSNVSYFIRIFSSLNGMSPGEYREHLQADDEN